MADDPSALIVPFGKHQGLTVAELLAKDPSYAQWLLSQNWLAQRFAELHAAILTRGTTPDDTPEHNLIQARFLDPSFTAALISRTEDLKQAQTDDLERRKQGPINQIERWEEKLDSYTSRLKHYPENYEDKYSFRQSLIDDIEKAEKYIKDHQRILDNLKPNCLVTDVAFEQQGVDVVISWKFANEPYYGNNKTNVEIKPAIGDDYPTIMRQMDRLGAKVLLIDKYNSDTLKLEVVREMFKANGQILVTLQDILNEIPNAKNFMGNSA